MQCDGCIYSTDDNVCACEDVIFNIDDECLSKIDIETYNRIYNKAIDDFVKKLLYQIGDLDIRDIIEETAEQLKAGGENE